MSTEQDYMVQYCIEHNYITGRFKYVFDLRNNFRSDGCDGDIVRKCNLRNISLSRSCIASILDKIILSFLLTFRVTKMEVTNGY